MVDPSQAKPRPKRVVWVTQPYYPDIQSTSHLLTELLEAMGDEAVEFTVICGHPVMLSAGAPAKFASPCTGRRWMSKPAATWSLAASVSMRLTARSYR